MLEILGVSRNGYYSFQTRKPSGRQLKQEKRLEEIRKIHKDSHDIYGAPKTAEEMRKKGDAISDKTVGNYMREIGIRACYTKHDTKTTIQPIDYDHAYRLVFEYINTFYNTVRLHSHCKYKSPQEYEEEYLKKMEFGIKGLVEHSG